MVSKTGYRQIYGILRRYFLDKEAKYNHLWVNCEYASITRNVHVFSIYVYITKKMPKLRPNQMAAIYVSSAIAVGGVWPQVAGPILRFVNGRGTLHRSQLTNGNLLSSRSYLHTALNSYSWQRPYDNRNGEKNESWDKAVEASWGETECEMKWWC